MVKLILKNVKLGKGLLNNIFQDLFNKILSQKLTHDKSNISLLLLKIFTVNMDKFFTMLVVT